MFCHARNRRWYADRSPDASLLEYLQEMTYALEVSARSRAEWAHAIRSGLACLRAVWLHGGGVLRGDLSARLLSFTSPLICPGQTAVRSGGSPHFGGTGSRSPRGSTGFLRDPRAPGDVGTCRDRC